MPIEYFSSLIDKSQPGLISSGFHTTVLQKPSHLGLGGRQICPERAGIDKLVINKQFGRPAQPNLYLAIKQNFPRFVAGLAVIPDLLWSANGVNIVTTGPQSTPHRVCSPQ